MLLTTTAPTTHIDDLDLRKCVLSGDLVMEFGREYALYARVGQTVEPLGTYPTAADAWAALDLIDPED